MKSLNIVSCKEAVQLKHPSFFSLPPSSLQEPSTKRVRPLGRVTSLANLISPVKNGAVRRFGQTIQVEQKTTPIFNLTELSSLFHDRA